MKDYEDNDKYKDNKHI